MPEGGVMTDHRESPSRLRTWAVETGIEEGLRD
jgi:hypothetical protein